MVNKMRIQANMGRMKLAISFLAIIAPTSRLCTAQSGTDVTTFINEVESEVKRIADQAVTNFNQSCELVASCGDNCSRQACVPLQDDTSGYVCKHVANNSNCYASNGVLGCQDLRVSMSRSFVRLPTGSNVTLISEANATICSQRNLDPTFKNISESHNNALNLTAWTYFASVEGVHRAFPGRDVSANNCTFEPRKRPWYMGVIAVKKDVVVLLDAGNSMGDDLPGDLLVTASTTKFQATVSIMTEFLDTLSFGDRITVIKFTSVAATAVLSPMTVNDTNVQSLKNALQQLAADSTQGASDLFAAFSKANETLTNSDSLKVILTFTDGQVLSFNSTAALFANIRSQKVLVQIYSYDRTSQLKTVLSQLACNCAGTYERISKTVSNPLWTLRSYYGVLARIRMNYTKGTPSWTSTYQDDGSLGTVITVVYPAFADNYTLVGVAGFDVLIEELGSIVQSDFSSALVNYGNTDSIAGLESSPLPCSFTLSSANECTNVSAPTNPLCLQTDTSGQTFEERVCDCSGICLASAHEPASKTSVTAAQISGIGVGAAAFLVLVVILCFLILKKKRNNRLQHGKPKAPLLDSTLHKSGSFPLHPYMDSLILVDSIEQVAEDHLGNSLRASPRAWGSQAGKDLIEYTKEELRAATDNWSEAAELGRGAHGLVYKGTFADGTVAAIKKPMRDVTQNAWDTFATELDLLSKLNHKRLVRLLGYCKEEIILVYEFMENGTLADCLHSPDEAGHKLGWEARLRIAMGAAKGLEYLHEYAVPKIYHGDVKPANILLDQNWEAHVSDFGLSLWSKDEKNSYLMASRMGGTFGYLDPEFVSSGQATFASDVYSFGIVLLELMSGRPVVVDYENIKDWAAALEDDDALEEILDPNLDMPINVETLIEIIRLALRCVERKKQDRPKMKEVASVLDHAWNYWIRSQHEGPPEKPPEEHVIEPR